jgi:hypothetical protein
MIQALRSRLWSHGVPLYASDGIICGGDQRAGGCTRMLRQAASKGLTCGGGGKRRAHLPRLHRSGLAASGEGQSTLVRTSQPPERL